MNAAGRYRAAWKAETARRRKAGRAANAQLTATRAAEIFDVLGARGFPVEAFAVTDRGALIEVLFAWPDLRRHFLLAMPAKGASSEGFGDGYRMALKAAGIR